MNPRRKTVTVKPYKLYTIEEAADELDVSTRFVSAMRDSGAPFPGSKTKPEWLIDWLKAHPDWKFKST